MASESVKRYNNILDIIEKRLIPDEEAKKARGEVFTPLNLVREMLFGLRKSEIELLKTKLPDIKNTKYSQLIWGLDEEGNFKDDSINDRIGGLPLSVWRNSKTKWLDPANGIGNFPIIAFYMLDYQLGHHCTDDSSLKGHSDINKKKRRRHIIEKMLYMIEINKGNVNTTRKIFKMIDPDANINICCANTLQMTDEKLNKEFGVNRFDVVMGNPPFNEGGTKTSGEKGFYKKFIQYGLNTLSNDGYLIFIHPPNFHRIDKDDSKKGISIKDSFNKNNLLFLRIIPDTKAYFNVQISIDYYILKKESNTKETVVLDKDNIITSNVDISTFDIVPNFGFGIIDKLKSLQKKHGSFEAYVGRDSSHDQRRIVKGEFKIVHYINKDGVRIFMSNKEHEHQKTKKVIVNGLGVPYILEDKEGKYGVSEGPYYVLEPSKKESIFLRSRLFQYLNWAFRIQGNKNDMFLFKILPDLNKLEYSDDESMMNNLRLNVDERKLIEQYNVPTFPLIEKIEVPGNGKTEKIAKPKQGGGSLRNSRFNKTRKNR